MPNCLTLQRQGEVDSSMRDSAESMATALIVQPPRRRKCVSVAGLAVYGACLVTSIGVALHHLAPSIQDGNPASDLRAPENYRNGIIWLPNSGGGCRHMMFDNSNGAFREDATASCPIHVPSTNSTALDDTLTRRA